jgi:NTE family protein
MNMMGGKHHGIYYPQQLPFAGFGHCHAMDSKLLVAGFKLQQRVFQEHYITVKGQVAEHNDKLGDIFDRKPIWGAQVGYCYNSIVGPLGASLSWSNFTHKVYPYISLGFDF